MTSLAAHLGRDDLGLVQLLDPPFDKGSSNPGYIKGYVPGVRENGGQYTHAAIWAAMAFAELGDARRAWELFAMLNPVNHTSSAQALATYKVEPFVMAADVYAAAPHTGRGGWTWYTGSAGWMYRLAVESLLGVSREGARLRIAPCLPPGWPGFKLRYRYGETIYRIAVVCDEAGAAEEVIDLVDDRAEHAAELKIRAHPSA
jgi:cellobiose phosphorylase